MPEGAAPISSDSTAALTMALASAVIIVSVVTSFSCSHQGLECISARHFPAEQSWNLLLPLSPVQQPVHNHCSPDLFNPGPDRTRNTDFDSAWCWFWACALVVLQVPTACHRYSRGH
jgi:hypothetical protein